MLETATETVISPAGIVEILRGEVIRRTGEPSIEANVPGDIVEIEDEIVDNGDIAVDAGFIVGRVVAFGEESVLDVIG